MSSKHPPIRVLGQRPLSSTLLFRSSNPNQSSDCIGEVKIKAPCKGSRVSLSDFLNRKLHKGPVLPTSVQGKERPFFSPVRSIDVSGSKERQNGVEKREDAEVKPVLDVVFEQFKCTKEENEDGVRSFADDEVRSSSTDNLQESRKRKNPFADGEKCARKPLVVLGDDPRPIHPIPNQKAKEQRVIASKKPRNLFNHYGNGSGWWDCNMEGVDNEEVGCNEVWEGIGSATLGGLEWH